MKAYKAKYLQEKDLLTANSYKHGTWACHGIVEVAKNLKRGACHLVRLGNMAIIVVPWLPTIHNFKLTTKVGASINICVKDLWCPHTKAWNKKMVRSIFIEEDANKVIELQVP